MEDKVCVVTGASEGSMGAGICKELAAAGFKKIVLISRTKSRLEATAEACKKIAAVETFVLPKDLAAPGTSAEAVKEIIDKYGRLDVLVHAAGIDVFAPIMDLKMEDAERVMKLNYFIPLELTKAALPHLRKTKGNVIFITSAIYVVQQFAVAGPPKGAMLLLSKILALEEAPHGVRSNAVSPGAINTGGLREYLGIEDQAKAEAQAKDMQPLKRCGVPEDIGKMVAFLADDSKSGFATGAEFFVDGAMSVAGIVPPPEK